MYHEVRLSLFMSAIKLKLFADKGEKERIVSREWQLECLQSLTEAGRNIDSTRFSPYWSSSVTHPIEGGLDVS